MEQNILIKLPESNTQLQFTTELVDSSLISVFRCSTCYRFVLPGDIYYNNTTVCGRHKKESKIKPNSGKTKRSPRKNNTGKKKRSSPKTKK